MIHQGEKILFSGTFETEIGGEWVTIPDLSSYVVSVLVSNPMNKKNLLFTSNSKDEERKIRIDGSQYTFFVSEKESAQLRGTCNVNIALTTEDGSPVISDDTGVFQVKESEIGRLLSKEEEGDE